MRNKSARLTAISLLFASGVVAVLWAQTARRLSDKDVNEIFESGTY